MNAAAHTSSQPFTTDRSGIAIWDTEGIEKLPTPDTFARKRATLTGNLIPLVHLDIEGAAKVPWLPRFY